MYPLIRGRNADDRMLTPLAIGVHWGVPSYHVSIKKMPNLLKLR